MKKELLFITVLVTATTICMQPFFLKKINLVKAESVAGDLNEDKFVDTTDLTMVSLSLLGDMNLSDEQLKTADVDDDKKVTLSDLVKYRRYISKIIPYLEEQAQESIAIESPQISESTNNIDQEPLFDSNEDLSEQNCVLYEHEFTAVNDEFLGNQDVTNEGMVVTDRISFNREYAISNRTVSYVCKFNDGVIAYFDTVNSADNQVLSRVTIDTVHKRIEVKGIPNSRPCDILNTSDQFMVSISKKYLLMRIEITNINTNETVKYDYNASGKGGEGEGAIKTDKYKFVPMQQGCYSLAASEGKSFVVSKMSVVSSKPDILIYGDSITEGEAYYPAEIFNTHWVQKIIEHSNGKAESSGRCGGIYSDIYNRMKSEIPFIKPKYVMITCGTNGGATVENYTTLVQYVKSQGCIPILNHIPCYNNNGNITGFRTANENIDIVRQTENVKGVDFDLVTSINLDGKDVDISTMWFETYSDNSYNYHHPNVKGSSAMFDRVLIDVPEIFD